MKQIILASGSPRRAELLRYLELPFSVRPIPADESSVDISAMPPEEAVRAICGLKCTAAAEAIQEDSVMITADTIVAIEGKILGKPNSVLDARQMLELLSGRQHKVYTSVFILEKEAGGIIKKTDFTECTLVAMAPLNSEEIDRYMQTGEPMDKAGAYGIQGFGGKFIRGIEGDFYNVMGLPLHRIYKALQTFGYLKIFY